MVEKVSVLLGPYGEQSVKVVGTKPFGNEIQEVTVMNMHGRLVILTNVTEGVCGDCNGEAHYRGMEITDGRTWLWCGGCDIGG